MLMNGMNNKEISCLPAELIKQWSSENSDGPEKYRPHSNASVWWECEQGHTWKARINNRVSRGTGCPYCAGKLPIKGENDLMTLHPELAGEWGPDNTDSPDSFLPQSMKKVQWKCALGHTWTARISHRVNGRGCPYCAGNLVIPGVTDLATLYPEVAAQWDNNRNDMTPSDYTAQSHARVWWLCDQGHSWQAPIGRRVNQWKEQRSSGCPVCAGKAVISGYNDLLTLAPDLAAEWDEDNTLTPSEITLYSNLPIHWKCEHGHRWVAKPNNRSRGTGCPYCAHIKLLPENSLQAVNPRLASEWDYERNKEEPADVAANSNTSVWWRCSRGHSWFASISNRNLKGQGCPYCSGRLVIPGETSLDVLRPEIAEQWDYEKNEDLNPFEFPEYSNTAVWWRCAIGHSWQAAISSRSNGSKCPYCSGRLAIPGETSLDVLHPELVLEWDEEKNGNLAPSQFTEHSSTSVWWKCAKGHSWFASISSRVNGRGCPRCNGRKNRSHRLI